MQNYKRILKMKEEYKLKNQNLKQERAITLVALVVTIVVLIVLATITITIVVGENGLINRAQQAKTLQENAKDKEELDMILLGYNLSNETKKAKKEGDQSLKTYLESEEGISNVKEKGDNLIVTFKGQQYTVNPQTLASGAYQTEGLNATDEEKVLAKLKDENTAMTVQYIPSLKNDVFVEIPPEDNGGETQEVFNQSNLGAFGVGWYVLSTDDEGVNLVSTVTRKSVIFKGSAGYDNCLYYLDKISKDLFTNEEQYGVTRDRVHALNLSDIKYAAEQMNNGLKIAEREWNWDIDFLQGEFGKAISGVDIKETKKYIGDTYYPGIYQVVNNEVITNNPLYDEAVISEPVKNDDGITSRPIPSRLTVTNTYISYESQKPIQMTNLGTFGSSKIGDTLFRGRYWLATRCIYSTYCAQYRLSLIKDGYLNPTNGRISDNELCNSQGKEKIGNNPFCIVVSVPASHINVADDGTVTLK